MIKPNKGYLVVEEDKLADKTSSGFYIERSAQEKQAKGKVLEGSMKGKTVYYSPYSAVKVEDVIVIKEEDVIAFEE